MSEHLDIWVKARALIAEQRNWCQGTAARDAEGRSLLPDWGGYSAAHSAVISPLAVSFCLAGAMGRAANDWNAGLRACDALAQIHELSLHAGFPGLWNDSHTHEEVLSLIDRGIASARASRTLSSLLDIPASPTRVNETV